MSSFTIDYQHVLAAREAHARAVASPAAGSRESTECVKSCIVTFSKSFGTLHILRKPRQEQRCQIPETRVRGGLRKIPTKRSRFISQAAINLNTVWAISMPEVLKALKVKIIC